MIRHLPERREFGSFSIVIQLYAYLSGRPQNWPLKYSNPSKIGCDVLGSVGGENTFRSGALKPRGQLFFKRVARTEALLWEIVPVFNGHVRYIHSILILKSNFI